MVGQMAGRKRGPATQFGDSDVPAKKRQLTKATFNKWQHEHEKDHLTRSWLRCDLQQDQRHVASLHCEVCTKYRSHLESMKNFSKTWVTGSTNLKVSNVLEHATSEVHKAAMTRMHSESAKARGESVVLQTPIGRSLCTLDDATRLQVAKRFDVAYVMAKESVPFAKYPSIVELEQRHGVNLGDAYNTQESAKKFTAYIARSQKHAFLSKLFSESHFYSLLMDGTTDAGNVEDELIVLVYCNKDDANQQMKTCTRFLTIEAPKKADASGLVKCVDKAVELLGVENVLNRDSVLSVEGKPVLVGIGTDGARVNIGDREGLKGQLQRALPWLFWGWCYAHRLELACKDAFSSTLFSSEDEMLLRIYYLYEKSPKKCRELESIAKELKEVFDLVKGGDRPIRSCGTRWITHKRNALQRIVDRYGVYIAHLSALVEDTSLESTDRARLKGYLMKWKSSKILVACCLYIEALKPVSILSLTMQEDSTDVVSCVESTLRSSRALQSLTEKNPGLWSTIESLKRSVKEVDGELEYQGVAVDNIDKVVDQCKKHVLADIDRLQQRLKDRLSWTDTSLLRSLLVLMETQSWQPRDEDDGSKAVSDVKEAAEHIVSIFRKPLESRGVCIPSIQDELEEAVEYAQQYLAIGREKYTHIWYKLHTSPNAQRWPNLLLLCELLFSLPFTTSRVEQMFSIVKNVKTKRRNCLHISTLCDLLELNIEGPSLSQFSADAAVDLWWTDCCTTRRVNQNPRKEYTRRGGSTSQSERVEDNEESQQPFVLDDWDSWMSAED